MTQNTLKQTGLLLQLCALPRLERLVLLLRHAKHLLELLVRQVELPSQGIDVSRVRHSLNVTLREQLYSQNVVRVHFQLVVPEILDLLLLFG